MLRKATGSRWPQKPMRPLARDAPGWAEAVGRVLADVRQIHVEGLEAVEIDFNLITLYDDLLMIPLADGPQIAAVGRRQAVGAAVELIVVERFVLFGGVVEDLQLDAVLAGVRSRFGRADGEAVVAARWQLEFEAEDEVVVIFGGQQGAAATGLALECASDDLVVVDSADPACEALSVEEAGEGGVAALDLCQAAIRLFGVDLADEDIAEAGFAAVRLQVDRPAGKDGNLAVVVVFQDDVVDDGLVVELDGDVGADHGDVHAIPLAGPMSARAVGNRSCVWLFHSPPEPFAAPFLAETWLQGSQIWT